MKKIYALLGFVLLVSACAKKDNPHSDRILEQANQMGQTLIKKDYQNYLSFVSPAVTNAVGGRATMVELLKQSTAQMEAGGYSFKAITFGEPGKIIDTANTLQCILPETLKMGTPEGDLLNHTSLLALSTDKGKTWVFAEVTPAKMAQLKSILPAVSSTHVVPESRTEKLK